MKENLPDYHIIIEAKNRVEVNLVYGLILFHMNKQEAVPFQLVQRFLTLLNDFDAVVDEPLQKESIEKALIAEQRINKYKGYPFDYTEADGTFISFNQILCESIFAYLKAHQEEPALSKEDTIQFFSQVINESFKPKLSEKTQKQLSKYKAAIIVAILTEICWTKITSQKNPTTEQLYDAVKNTLNKMPGSKLL